MEKFLQINTEDFLRFYDSCTKDVRESLKPLFGKQITEYLCFKIKSYEDASKYLYNKILNIDTSDKKIVSFFKLKIINEALNDGWNKNSDNYYYPIFTIEDSIFKFKSVKIGSYSNEFPFSNPFKFRDAELAKYCGETFIELWRDYYA